MPFRQERRNMWTFDGEVDAICVTTNGFVKADGKTVMGKGNALQAVRRYPELPELLGQRICEYGLRVEMLLRTNAKTWIVAFPTKCREVVLDLTKPPTQTCDEMVSHVSPKFIDQVNRDVVKKRNSYAGKFDPRVRVPGWMCKSSTQLIEKSAQQLAHLATVLNLRSVVLPRPGCANGGLSWSEVGQLLDEVLDERFIVVDWQGVDVAVF